VILKPIPGSEWERNYIIFAYKGDQKSDRSTSQFAIFVFCNTPIYELQFSSKDLLIVSPEDGSESQNM
jgi:hypothetical protein